MDDNFIDLLRTLETWQVFTLGIIGVLLYFAFKTGLIDKLFKSKKEVADLKIQNEIKRIKNEMAERAFKNIEGAAHKAVESLEHCIGANYYVIHDSGEDLLKVKDWYLAVLRSTSFAVGTDYANPVLMNNGFRYLNEQARDNLYHYNKNSWSDKNLEGLDLDYMKAMNIKSVALALVKNEGHVYHMVSLNFDIDNASMSNPNKRAVVMDFKRSVLTNI